MKLKRVYIEITNICNLNCSFCSKITREKREMTLEEFEHILNEIKPFNPHIYLHIKGEPLIHSKLKEILKCAQKYGLPVNLTTNGTLIENNKELLIDYARQVNISLHSLSENQIKDYDKYINSVCEFGLMAKENKKPYVSYRMWNAGETKELSEDAYIILSKVAEKFGFEIEKALPKGRDAKKLCDNVFISFMEKFEWPSLKNKEISVKGSCLGAKEMIGILCDGTVVPCCLDGDGIIKLGNIFKEPLSEILKKERYINILNGFSGGNISEELCRKCSYRTRFDKKEDVKKHKTTKRELYQ